jgi:DNA-binding transcriptional LysR family regulator
MTHLTAKPEAGATTGAIGSAFPRGLSPNQLRYFVTVAREGQITSAAHKLGLAQPALSQSITQLEGQIGVMLFERHARGVTLTSAGELFFEKADAAVKANLDAERAAAALARSARDTIVFGHHSLPPWLADPELIESFTKARPDVEIRPKQLSFPSAPASAWLAEVDVVIIGALAPDANVWVVPISSYPRALLVAETHRLAGRKELSVDEVLDETFVAFDPSVDPVWAASWNLDGCRGGSPPKLTVEHPPDAQARFRMVASGLGVSTSLANHPVLNTANIPGVVAIPIRDAPPVVSRLSVTRPPATKRSKPLLRRPEGGARSSTARSR